MGTMPINARTRLYNHIDSASVSIFNSLDSKFQSMRLTFSVGSHILAGFTESQCATVT